MTQFPTTIDELQDVLRGRRKLPPTRIGRASVGRILLMLMHHILSVCLPAEVMQSTMRAVYTYLITPELPLDENVDSAIFTAMQTEIDLSVARSEKARARAALRKAARLAATMPEPAPSPAPLQHSPISETKPEQMHTPKPISTSKHEPMPEPTSTHKLETTHAPTSAPRPEPTSTTKPGQVATSATERVPVTEETADRHTDNTVPAESPAPARTKTRKKPADPDAPSFTYRYPAEKPPKCRVIKDDEEESAPYDPYGIRAGIKRQTRYGTPVRPHNW